MPREDLEPILAAKLKAMTKTEQRQFFSLHNNFPGRYILNGVVRTNALPCGPSSSGVGVGGVYATICLINHSCLPNCHSLLQVLEKEFDGHNGAHAGRLYNDAFEICVSHGDQARASTFAEKCYKARVSCEGEDSPRAQRMKSLSLAPTDHMSYGSYSVEWELDRNMVPKGVDEAQFEAWLFKEQR